MSEREYNNKYWFQTLMCTRFDCWCLQPEYGRAKNRKTLKIKSDEMIMYASNFCREKSFPRTAAASKPNNLIAHKKATKKMVSTDVLFRCQRHRRRQQQQQQ